MFKLSKKLVSLITLALIIIIGAYIFFGHSKSKGSPDTLSSCKNNLTETAVKCVENFVYLEVQKDPSQAVKVLDEIWSGKMGIDLRLFSPLAHNLGMGLIDQKVKLVTAIKFCGQSFKGACIHGTVMEYVDSNFPPHSPATAFINLCDSLQLQINEKQYENCVHGVGHELRAKLVGQNEQVITECNYFKSQYRGSCASGVLMESSKGNLGFGQHSDSPVGKVKFDCSKMAKEYKLICYSSLGSYLQYEADSEPFADTFNLCSALQGAVRTYCFAGANERLLMSKSGDLNLAIEFCKTLPLNEMRDCMMVKTDSLDNLE